MNLRKAAYFTLLRLRGQELGANYKHFLRQDRDGIPPDTSQRLLVQLLTHCQQSVPYYTEVMRNVGGSFQEEPEEYLRRFPILTKDTLRSCFELLKSTDLSRRKWYLNSSGGSTGVQVQFIQDWEYAARSGAITLLFSKLVGREVGECEIYLWGSTRDIVGGSKGWKAVPVDRLTNTDFLNAFTMTPEQMHEHITILNTKRPKLIIAYVDAIYELGKFAEQAGFEVAPQTAIIATAGTLYPFMREKIEKVFQCRVFNRYGSREVGDIACERPGVEGLWIAPWGNYIEIVDSDGNRVPDGTEGEILVTSLANFAMPLVRYRIGDCGALSPATGISRGGHGQVFDTVVGRTCDIFRNRNGTLVHVSYFGLLLSFRDWISRYQVVQKTLSSVVFRIVQTGSDGHQVELDEIAARTKLVMGDDCEVIFEFLDEIAPSGSGKFRYFISEVQPQ